MKRKLLHERLTLACRWISDVAQVLDETPLSNEERKHHHVRWMGSIRGEYRLNEKSWGFFCPIWHTGQAIKALVMASDILGDTVLHFAEAGAEFILNNAVREGQDRGLILAYEDDMNTVNTSAIMEGLDGLFLLTAKTDKPQFQNAALMALEWIAKTMYLRGRGLFLDCYDPLARATIPERYGNKGRPLLDDGVFLKGFNLSGNEMFKMIALETAERLLQDEEPEGNWIRYAPCSMKEGVMHPRQAYWWGYPMLQVYQMTGDERFWQTFKRSVWWYAKAMRKDGGLIRRTYCDFNTDSFGHATSGVACALCMFMDYYRQCGDREILPYLEKGLNYCLRLQFLQPEDQNVRGAILEKVLPPNGTDQSPYHVRDLGTIFFIQAVSKYIKEIAS